jgi:murein DD-endopeptidase MepM/ murein hydrolase activator NlpD
VRKEFHKGMGNVIATRNGNIYALYAHLSRSLKELGDKVEAGELLALSGNTGTATTYPHLHFEMRNLTKSVLSEMVFNPPFDKELSNYTEVFEHKIKNENTPKTLTNLSERYFGTDKYWKKLALTNGLEGLNKHDILTEGSIIKVPNY